jgi:pilus assembly protein CpaF
VHKLKTLYEKNLESFSDNSLEQNYLNRSLLLRKILYSFIQELLLVTNSSSLAINFKEQLNIFDAQKSFASINDFYLHKANKARIFRNLIDDIFSKPAVYNIVFPFAPSRQDIEWTKTLLIFDFLYYGPISLVFLMKFFLSDEFYHNNAVVFYMHKILDYKKVSEIRVNSSDEIFIDYENKTINWQIPFLSEEHVEIVIKRMISESNILNNSSIKINAYSAIADFEHPCGSIRGSAVIPPVSEKAFFTLRIHPQQAFTLKNLIEFGMFNQKIKNFFIALQQAGTSIAIAGTMGSGKTTLLSALAESWPDNGRKAIIEDTPELKPQVSDLIKMRTSDNANAEDVSVAKLTKACKRHSIRYVILSEARDASAWEILQLSQSILGSIMTYHYTLRSEALLADQALNALVALCKQHELAPKNNDIKYLIADMVQILILVEQSLDDKVRRIKKIFYVNGFDEANGGVFKATELFSFDKTKQDFVLVNHCQELVDYLSSKGVVYSFND